MTNLELAILFHETYERLAPSFGYETRPDTKAFDPESKNGRLMIAVVGEVMDRYDAAVTSRVEPSVVRTEHSADCCYRTTGDSKDCCCGLLEPKAPHERPCTLVAGCSFYADHTGDCFIPGPPLCPTCAPSGVCQTGGCCGGLYVNRT